MIPAGEHALPPSRVAAAATKKTESTSAPEVAEKDQGVAMGTCGAFSILDLCEQAHRDITKQALCLRDEDLRTEEIRRHLSDCPECARWYRSACGAYTRLSGSVTLSRRPIHPYPPRRRTWDEIVPAAESPGIVLLRVKGNREEGEGLDALDLFLEWVQEARGQTKAGSPWSVTLKLLSRENDPEFGYERDVLEQFDGYAVQLERLVVDRSEPEKIVTRLGFDAEQNLVSIPRVLDSAGPKETTTITLTLLDRVDQVIGD
jgi:hypothetical protein